MAQINFTNFSEQENQIHNRNAKQIGDPHMPRSTKKKTALADVKNILAQRTVHSTKKPSTSTVKSSIQEKVFGVFSDKENDICKKEGKKDVDMLPAEETCTISHNVLMNEADCEINLGFEQPVCSFCTKVEDDNADFMMKSITLSKSEVRMLALEWERPPIVGIDDMRKMETVPAIQNEIFPDSDWPGFDYEYNEPDISLLCDIPAVDSEE